jgi:hypothetical protein
MANPTIEINKKQIINALVQFSPRELKGIIGELFRQKSFVPPTLEEITKEAGKIVKRERLKPEIVQEAIKWARSKK